MECYLHCTIYYPSSTIASSCVILSCVALTIFLSMDLLINSRYNVKICFFKIRRVCSFHHLLHKDPFISLNFFLGSRLQHPTND